MIEHVSLQSYPFKTNIKHIAFIVILAEYRLLITNHPTALLFFDTTLAAQGSTVTSPLDLYYFYFVVIEHDFSQALLNMLIDAQMLDAVQSILIVLV